MIHVTCYIRCVSCQLLLLYGLCYVLYVVCFMLYDVCAIISVVGCKVCGIFLFGVCYTYI